MNIVPITLTGYVAGLPTITGTSDGLMVQFGLVYSPSDDAVDDATLPCVIYEADTSREDAEAFFVPGAAIRVTGRLHLPGAPGETFALEATDVEEDGEDQAQAPDLVDVLPQTPVSVTTLAGHCLLECTQPDGTPLWHVIDPDGTAFTAYNQALIPWAIDLLTPRD